MNLFKGREDSFAVQQDKGDYVRKFRPFLPSDAQYHFLETVSTFSMYPLRNDSCVYLCCIDIDVDMDKFLENEMKYGKKFARKILLEIAKEEAIKQSKKLKELNLVHAVEYSGRRGYHIWLFFNKAIPAKFILKLKKIISIPINPKISSNPSGFYEFFPKQDEGLGNPIKMPLGKHRVSNEYSYFLDIDTYNIHNDQLNYLLWLDKNGRIKANYLEQLVGEKIDYTEIKI
ncbi:MAG: hypothetical protein WC934_06025, partial [Acidithiobacillus sp.]|uniref:TOTE conflict system archaeo-eukaryotic primase domain-containing protein n=1 Tax=Acidithiobacillus sp. TaxID=1872118 RepID=UPI00355F215E